MMKFGGQTLIKCDFLKGQLSKFFQEICSSGGKQIIRKLSAASTVKDCNPPTSLKRVKSNNKLKTHERAFSP